MILNLFSLIDFVEFYISNLFRRKRNFKDINELREFLQTIPRLNSGGCGISALVMFRWMKKYNWKPDIIFAYGDDNADGYEVNENARNNNADCYSAPTHAILKTDTQYFDSHGAWEYINYSYSHTISEDLLVRAINDAKNWNKAFRRNLYLSRIKKVVTQIDLSDIN